MDIETIYRLYFRDVCLFLQGLTRSEALAEELTHTGQFSALWATRRHLSPRIRCFIDFMSENGILKP